jgi:nucleoside-diphosphate-sugar epimerase
VVVIRPAQVYGPGDTRKAKFYKMVQQGVIVNPGHTMKHLVYIDDLSRAFEMAMGSDKAIGEIFIIAGENAMALQELVHIVARELGVPAPRIRLPATPIIYLCAVTEVLCQTIGVKPPLFRRSMDFFTRSVEFDVTKARTELGFRSQIDIPNGVARTVAWYREKGLL